MKWDTTVPSPCGLSLVLRHHREMMEMTWDIMVPSPFSLSLVLRHHGKMTGMMWDTTVSSPCGLSLVLGYHKSVISLWSPIVSPLVVSYCCLPFGVLSSPVISLWCLTYPVTPHLWCPCHLPLVFLVTSYHLLSSPVCHPQGMMGNNRGDNRRQHRDMLYHRAIERPQGDDSIWRISQLKRVYSNSLFFMLTGGDILMNV